MMKITWEQLDGITSRAKVPGGWFVRTAFENIVASGIFFYPDLGYTWDGDLLTKFKWEQVDPAVSRAKVPGGWFIRTDFENVVAAGIFFYPDPGCKWDDDEDL